MADLKREFSDVDADAGTLNVEGSKRNKVEHISNENEFLRPLAGDYSSRAPLLA